ncbi:hypothetical protein COCC4DRAFT_61405 [Bipolaris maydis ATCC 48331]|uniref:Uncharacterized protein n=2 Tax=Cochliobolus heterostrophus TaxID=5016 RepID=M2U2T4_COCH5|nr:uncharacterized protein COCC4DRAFT_61405 [Bipolaris maydis ATCC 48331]EMD92819.1 hypothetical protein COCHEDRAFT_1132950 [Bipolaris maydis C5]ENI04793.1 hypothetical protein COCC4DRAFT_61405 [Bipolaris maydis ATCC 48331]KAJ5026097.1 hypothetical protein J3E73DRAFT_313174 [Bipolaris maydis]
MLHTQYTVLYLCIRARRAFYSLCTEAHVKGLTYANLDALVLLLLVQSSCFEIYRKLVTIFGNPFSWQQLLVLIHAERRTLKSVGHWTSAEVRPDIGS